MKKKSFLKYVVILLVVLYDFPYSYAQITRQQIENTAMQYVTGTWTANSWNINWNQSCGGKTVRSAPWVTVGTRTSMPYMWGGWTTWAQHNTNMASSSNPKSAGDINTSTDFGVPSCASGHDCSGLVSRAWNLGDKYGTATLSNVSTQIQYSQLQKGDIVNKVNDHTRLIKVYNSNGSANIIEATTSQSANKVREYSYSPIQQTGYIPLCYNNVAGGCGGGTPCTPPSNDHCANATTITSNGSCLTGTVACATGSYGANNCGNGTSPDDNDVYYKFTAQATSHTVTVSNYASNFDAVIELRTACAPGSGNYISCYDPSGTPSSVSFTWNSLNIGQTYYVRIYEYNNAGTPPNSPTFQICVTHSGSGTDCSTPTGTTETNITQTAATLDWNNVSGAIDYRVQYRQAGNSSWQNQYPTSSILNLTGLQCNTSYEWRVRAECSSQDSSYSSIRTFTTSACSGGTNPCNNIIPIGGCGSAYSQTFTGTSSGAWNGNDCYDESPGSEQIYSFVAPATGVYSIQVSSTNGEYVDYLWKSGSCNSNNWNCIGDISGVDIYEIDEIWYAGTTYYILLDNEYYQNYNGTHTFYIDCQALSSVNYDFQEQITVYPNPTDGILHISSNYDLNITGLYVYDITGKFIEKAEGKNLTEINIRGLSSGVYLLKIVDYDNKTSIHKIIKE